MRVALACVPHGVEVSVSDNGPGIPPERLGEVFEKFRQLSDPKSGKPSGTGLGLAICRRIVEHLGGKWVRRGVKVTVASRYGSGSIYTFGGNLALEVPA